MIPNIHQSIEEIIKNSSAGEKILWQQIRLLTGENAAVQQMYYYGLIPAGHELLVYSANKLYIGLELCAYCRLTPGTNFPFFEIYNEANVLSINAINLSTYFDAVAAVQEYAVNPVELKNIYFSRIAISVYQYVKFIGYKLTR